MLDFVVELKKPWQSLGLNFCCQINCLRIPPLDNGVWDLALPRVSWNPRSVVLMHCQDFINLDDRGVRELQLMEQYFRERSQQVVAVTWEIDLQERYFGPIHLSYFPTHTFNIITNMRRILPQWQPGLLAQRQRRYQCLNGIPRPHRVRTVQALDQLGVPGHVSLGRERELPTWPYYPTYRGCENEDNYLRLLPVYGDSEINVVTETVYEQRPGIISEKTLFALMSLQVPLLIGYRGLVDHVRGLGFDTFDDVIDTSYDHLPDDVRVEEAIGRNASVLTHGTDRAALMSRLQRNQELVLSWPERMIKDYQHRCAEIQDSLAKQ